MNKLILVALCLISCSVTPEKTQAQSSKGGGMTDPSSDAQVSCPQQAPAPPASHQELNHNIIEVHNGTYPPIAALWTSQLISAGITGKTWVGPLSDNQGIDSLHKNKKRHTIVFVPSLYNTKKSPELLIWLHGHNGFNKFDVRILRHLDTLYSRGKNLVIIAVEQPWSHWTKTRTSRNGTGPFRAPGEFEVWMDEVFSILGQYGINPELISSKNITLIGHSAGGSGIMSMAKSGALGILDPQTIVFSDSTYGRWFDVVYDKHLKDRPGTDVYVLTKKHGPPWRSMKRFYRERKGSPISKNIVHIALSKGWSHKRIGDNCVLYPGTPFIQ